MTDLVGGPFNTPEETHHSKLLAEKLEKRPPRLMTREGHPLQSPTGKLLVELLK